MAGRLKRILFKPFHQFFQLQTSSGILLLAATLIALFWANSPWKESYEWLWHLPVGLQVGSWRLVHSLHFWINDALMAVFFFVVGLEIKRELWVGELSSSKKAVLPFMAAFGGMLFPALIYLAIVGLQPGTAQASYQPGWGIATVTDIAFALGVLALLGERVPLGLKVFLTALAIIDDLGAIVLIALFYSHGLQWEALGLVALIMVALLALNRLKVDAPLPYAVLGLFLWWAILNSGLHATLAGVLLAFTIPASSRLNPVDFYERGMAALKRFQAADSDPQPVLMLTNQEHQASVQELELMCEAVQSPLQQLEHILHPWVSYGILPLFALANAGVLLPSGGILEAFLHPIGLGVMAGLFLGKPLGIFAFSWLAVRLKLAELPEGVNWPLIAGAGILGGIGFTMSLFISDLAFAAPDLVNGAKTGVLLASACAGLVGSLVLWKLLPTTPASER
jgi:NhaA family Na+:H+ antiporter